MSTSTANYTLGNPSNVNGSPASPVTPRSPSGFPTIQQSSQRSFINLVRGQSAPFPATPTSAHMNGSFDPPPGVSYLDFIRTWNDVQVSRWLTEIKCANHATTFKTNDIRGDILLELDQATLKEMGISSIGDRLRIVNGVKLLRQKVSSSKHHQQTAPPTPTITDFSLTRINTDTETASGRSDTSPTTRLRGRPAPLQLSSNSAGRNDLPRLIREQQPPDSAKNRSHPSTATTPAATTPISSNSRSNAAQPNAIHRAQPPSLPPSAISRAAQRGMGSSGRRTPTPGEAPPITAQPLPTPPQNPNTTLSPPATNVWSSPYHLPADPRPGNAGSNKPAQQQQQQQQQTRAPSPNQLPPRTTSRQQLNNIVTNNGGHQRNWSLGVVNSPTASTTPVPKQPPRPGTSNGSPSHPYATANPSLLGPPASKQQQSYNLSPIAEGFHPSPISSTPSPPLGHGGNRGSPANQNINPSLDDLRKYIVKFLLPQEGHSWKISIADCAGGVEILEKVLKKLDKGGSSRATDAPDRVQLQGGGLSVDGWSVYLDGDGLGDPLTEAELLTICHSLKHPARENGLTLRRTSQRRQLSIPSTSVTSKATRRASSLSILSELGVSDPERALHEPTSPTQSTSSNDRHLLNPNTTPPSKKPSKLRNFFGQRPPSELITNHLQEYFPFTEKKVLERTARNSMMRTNTMSSTASGRRDSTMSWNAPPQSRFSSSTQGSASRQSFSSVNPPPLPEKKTTASSFASDDIPRVSLSTDDGQSVELNAPTPTSDGNFSPHLLPPIPFPTESLSQSWEDVTKSADGSASTSTQQQQNKRRRSSRTPSNASKRGSYMTELRSRKDTGDTASLMTVDQITVEVESRRESLAIDRMAIDSNSNSEIDELTEVDEGQELKIGAEAGEAEVEVEVAVSEDDEEEEEEEEEEEDGDETIAEEELVSDEEDGTGKATTSNGIKWIKGALIGSGSFGKVYLGMDASNGLLMAVKQVELPTAAGPNEERKKSMLSALEREIELLKDLQHENIVQYLYSSLDDEFLNIFLEYVPGGSVTALLGNYGAFEETLCKNFVRQILLGLEYLHERDIIHRDIKGANILVDNKGGIKISDFGISKKVEANLLMNRAHRPSLQGSVFWMAPEVVKQTENTSKADIWSVGCLVVEMLTGEHPWAQLNQMQAMFKIGSATAKPTIPSDISAEAQDFLARTFELKHQDRPSATELLSHPWIAKKQPGTNKTAA